MNIFTEELFPSLPTVFFFPFLKWGPANLIRDDMVNYLFSHAEPFSLNRFLSELTCLFTIRETRRFTFFAIFGIEEYGSLASRAESGAGLSGSWPSVNIHRRARIEMWAHKTAVQMVQVQSEEGCIPSYLRWDEPETFEQQEDRCVGLKCGVLFRWGEFGEIRRARKCTWEGDSGLGKGWWYPGWWPSQGRWREGMGWKHRLKVEWPGLVDGCGGGEESMLIPESSLNNRGSAWWWWQLLRWPN